MQQGNNRVLRLLMAAILLVSMFLVAGKGAVYVNSMKASELRKICIVVDAGHGGADPGKVGINKALEKEINLQIAILLRQALESKGIKIVMTRENDKGLYEEKSSNKKVQDMKNRLELIEKNNPELVISIHQNSYHEEYVKGAQVFYYETSTESKRLAGCIQEELRILDPENKRVEKGNTSYYLLKKTPKPIVIVECGFLSNYEEAEKLTGKAYQEKLAMHITQGILNYLEGEEVPAIEVVKKEKMW